MKMLVYSEPGLISLLPCKPQQWRSGHINGVALRGGIIVQELSWNEKEVKVTLLSKIDQNVKIQLREAEMQEIVLKQILLLPSTLHMNRKTNTLFTNFKSTFYESECIYSKGMYVFDV